MGRDREGEIEKWEESGKRHEERLKKGKKQGDKVRVGEKQKGKSIEGEKGGDKGKVEKRQGEIKLVH